MTNVLSDEQIETMGKALRDFGYDMDNALVRQYADEILAGKSPNNGPKMFIHGWLKDARILSK